MKRLFDIIFSFSGIVLLLPLIALVAILVKIDSLVLFLLCKGEWVEIPGPFNLCKFRTMAMDPQKQGMPIVNIGKDPEYTRIGGFLRKTKLADLLQLFNALKGDMSIVGLGQGVKEYVTTTRMDHNDIQKMKPGITDISNPRLISMRSQILRDRTM